MILKYVDPIVNGMSKLFDMEIEGISIYSIVIRLFLAIVFGGIIGAERASKKHVAGVRTYIIVCVGSAIAMLTNEFLFESNMTSDASRLAAQVISGVGFLGAGTIMITSRSQIKGLTTAAGLWACACVGLSIGSGFYTLSIIGVLTLGIVLLFLPRFEQSIKTRSGLMNMHVELNEPLNLSSLMSKLRSLNATITLVENNVAYNGSGLSVYTITILIPKEYQKGILNREHFLDVIRQLDYVHYVEEIK